MDIYKAAQKQEYQKLATDITKLPMIGITKKIEKYPIEALRIAHCIERRSMVRRIIMTDIVWRDFPQGM